MRFAKYHALGNDYLVVEGDVALDARTVRRLCDRHRGLGSDGVLLAAPAARRPGDEQRVRIYNPDGGEAAMSGNGLRIFGRWLVDERGAAAGAPLRVRTSGATATVTVHSPAAVAITLPPPTFATPAIPVAGPAREILDEPLALDGETVRISTVSVGNPHCVLRREASEAEARRLGPRLETHPLFPERTNVQLFEVVDRATLRLEIWERGAGYTLASGSSACAATSVAWRLGWVDGDVAVRMPGGTVRVRVGSGRIELTGPVARVASGVVDPELLEAATATE